ncbi:MAG: hypothetical protein U0821_21295 [Chloroflexota bacterium]
MTTAQLSVAAIELSALASLDPAISIIWSMRRAPSHTSFGGGSEDLLPQCGKLGHQARLIYERHRVRPEIISIAAIRQTTDGLVTSDDQGHSLPPVDQIVVCTGFRPDLELLREVRLALHVAAESSMALAPLIDPNVHSCGTVSTHGAQQLAHPESVFCIIDMKSHGREPTFLLLTGHEQARSVAAAIAGAWDSARHVELTLPATGVCSTGASAAAAVCYSSPVPVAQDLSHSPSSVAV